MRPDSTDHLGLSPAPLAMQRALLDQQLPILLLSGVLLVLAGALHFIDTTRALVAEVFALAALASVWGLRARLPLGLAQVVMLLFVLVTMWAGVSATKDASAVIVAGVLALYMIGLSSGRSVRVLSVILSVAALIIVQRWLPGVHMGAALPLLLCATLLALSVVGLMRSQVGSQYAARQQADLLLGERERLLLDFRQRNEAFRRLVEKDAAQKAAELQRANRQLREANSHLEAFNYMVSHDIRASLRILDGLAKVLMEDIQGQRPGMALQNLGRLQNSLGNMQRMVHELLSMAKSGKKTLQRQTVDLGAIMRELVSDRQAAEPQRRVHVEIAGSMSACVQPELMREVLQNLLSNAWKFTAQRADARIQFGVTGGAEQIYYVRDNGVGFDVQRATEMFKPFTRLHAEQGYEGTGVGLASVKRIIERHGGRVWALAEPHGTKLCFTLGAESLSPCEDVASVG